MADQDKILDMIRQHESGGQNVPNYMFDPEHTAQGYYQITNTTWNDSAPKAGVDTKKYPNAMSAPEDVQRKVAQYILTQTPQGIGHWANFNPQLKAALSGEDMADQQQSYNDMTDEQLRELVSKDPKLSKRMIPLQTSTQTSDKKGNVNAPPKNAPPKTFMQSLKAWGESPSTSPEQSFWTGTKFMVPGLKQAARGVSEFGDDWRSGIKDVIRGGETAAIPPAIGALIGTTAGAGAGALMEGAGLGEAALASGSSLWPAAKAAGFGLAGEGLGQLTSQDPKTRDAASAILGLAGAAYGPRLKMPSGRIAPAVVRQIGRFLPIPGSKMVGDFLSDWMLSGHEPPMPSSSPAPTGKVKPPTIPATPEADAMVGTKSLTPDQYIAHMKSLGMEDDLANAKLAHAQSKAAKDALKNAPQNPPGPTITPAAPGTPPVNVQLQPGLTITQGGSPAFGGTSGTSGVPSPAQPNAPVGPPPPQAIGPSGAGVPAPAQPPSAQPPPNLPPVPAFGRTSSTLSKEALAPEPLTDAQFRAQKIADAASISGKPLPRNKLTLRPWIKILGFDPTLEDVDAGNKLFGERQAAKKPTANNPGKERQ